MLFPVSALIMPIIVQNAIEKWQMGTAVCFTITRARTDLEQKYS